MATAPLSYNDKKQLVEFLLRRKFPWSWAPPPLQTGRDSDPSAFEVHRATMERIAEERRRLLGLPESDLRALQAEEDAKDKAKRDAELAAYDGYFFGPDAEADYDFWTKAEYWTFDEAVSLLLGKEPKKLPLPLLEARKKGTPFGQRYARLEELARRSSVMASQRLQPQSVVLWAKRIGAVDQIPQGLLPVLDDPAATPSPPTPILQPRPNSEEPAEPTTKATQSETKPEPELLAASAPANVQRESAEQRQDRRLARFLELGGLMKRVPGAWNVDTLKGRRGALAALVTEEKSEGRPRSDRKDVSADLSAAAERQIKAGKA